MARALNRRQLEKLQELYGEVEATFEGKLGAVDLSRYRDDPVGFQRDILHDEPWSRQVEMAEAVRDHAQVAVRGANGVGKDHEAAVLMLWWVYTRPGALALSTGPTQRQVDEIVFGRELKRLLGRSGLPGELRAHALRLPDSKVTAAGELESGILGFVSTDLGKMRGHHAPNVFCTITEATDVIDGAFEAMFNNAVGENDRMLIVANPTEPTGRFYRATLPRSGWHSLRIAAYEHPNIVEGRTVLPGGPTKTWLEKVRREEGEGSRFWQIYVEAEFPDQPTDALVTRGWIEASDARWAAGMFESSTGMAPVVGLDVAREGGDLCVAAPVLGRVVKPVVTWEPNATNPTLDTVLRAEAVMVAYGGFPEPNILGPPALQLGQARARGVFVVDVALMGGGVVDRLRERGWDVVDWNGQRAAREAQEPERWENMRGWGYWTLREAYQHGGIVCAPDERLAEDLLATRYEAGLRDRTKIIRKPEIKAALGRSPDRADAVMMGWMTANGGAVGAGGADTSTPVG